MQSGDHLVWCWGVFVVVRGFCGPLPQMVSGSFPLSFRSQPTEFWVLSTTVQSTREVVLGNIKQNCQQKGEGGCFSSARYGGGRWEERIKRDSDKSENASPATCCQFCSGFQVEKTKRVETVIIVEEGPPGNSLTVPLCQCHDIFYFVYYINPVFF